MTEYPAGHPCQIDLRTNPDAVLPERPVRFCRMHGAYSWWVLPCGTMSTAPDIADSIHCWNCDRHFVIEAEVAIPA